MARRSQSRTRIRPSLESLEDRQLLSGGKLNKKDVTRLKLQLANGVPPSDRRLLYKTPDGTNVAVTLYGLGTLAGSTVDATGALHLVYDNTSSASRILGHTSGGNGHAKLASIRDADVAPLDLSGIGSNQVGGVKLIGFDLIDGGRISLSGGVNDVQLNSIGANTTLDLRSLPPTSQQTNPSPTSVTESLSFQTTAGGGQELTGFGGFTVPGSTTGVSSGSSSSSNGFTTVNLGNGNIVQVPTTTSSGTSTTIRPEGVNLFVKQINGVSNATGPLVDAPQIFGYDPTANALIRFNATTGAVIQAIDLPGSAPASGSAGVGLGEVGNSQVVLVGQGPNVLVYTVNGGDFVGSFTTASLASSGINTVDGIADSDNRTYLVDTTAGTNGTAIGIDVAKSLSTGQAVASGTSFTPTNEFMLNGGGSGIAGSAAVFFTGSAHFNTFTPDQVQLGVAQALTSSTKLTQLSLTQIKSPTSIVTVDPAAPPTYALGSIDQSLALVTSVADGQNVVTLYNPATLAKTGSVNFDYPNRLTGLSESFHPELNGTAIVNVRGITNQIVAQSVSGLVYNDLGYLGLINVRNAVNSQFIGLPVGHVDIGRRQNVTILSSVRGPGKRGGVTIQVGLSPQGPFDHTGPA